MDAATTPCFCPFVYCVCIFSYKMCLQELIHLIRCHHAWHRPHITFALGLCRFDLNVFAWNTMLSESRRSAAQVDPLQPSCEYVYMHFTQEPQ